MKKHIYTFIFIIVIVLISSCKKDESPTDPNVIGGNTNIPLGQVGNQIDVGSILIGGSYYPITASIQVTKNENGVATLKITGDLTKNTQLGFINNIIPSNMKDANGKINTEIKFKATSEGIQDYFNDDKPFTIVKYDAKVGDQWSLTRADGKTRTRKVTARSETDDFPYGLMYIKTITVEHESKTPGVKKYIYKANHKFGLVHVTVQMEDGKTASVYFYPKNY
ncbi:MAG: hypothetical protein N3A61_01760 [Ignavibacteria bacterium]|nr:hypothetical protein [Ignavibacteria bacterium]